MATIQINTYDPAGRFDMTYGEAQDFFLYVAMRAEDAGHDFRYVDAVSGERRPVQRAIRCRVSGELLI